MTNIFQYSIFILLIGSLAVSATGCDFIYGLLQKEGAEERKVLGQMSPLEANAEVRRVQTFLKIYGYNVGNPDGVMGMNTRLALGKFQEDNDLKPSRFVDYETWGRLLFHEEIGLIKDGKLHIESVQQALKNAGFDPGSVDGRAGNKTWTALKSFQQAKGLKPDGRAGLKTLRELAQYLD